MHKKIKGLALASLSLLIASNLTVANVYAASTENYVQSIVSNSDSDTTFTTSARVSGSDVYSEIYADDGAYTHSFRTVVYFYNSTGRCVASNSKTLEPSSRFRVYIRPTLSSTTWTSAKVNFYVDGSLVATEQVYK